MSAEIELRKMRLVVAVAQERNFTRAACRCHLTQPALSRHIKEVEEMLGTELFSRQGRCIQTTQAGKLFVREALRTLEQSQRTISLVRAYAKQQEHPITVGVSLLADLSKCHSFIRSAQQSLPKSTIAVHRGYTPDLISKLLRGDIDIALVDSRAQASGVQFHLLFAEPLIVVSPEKLRWCGTAAIRLKELLTLPLVLLSESVDPGRAVLDDAIASAGGRAFKIHDVQSVPELLDEVALNGRVGLLRQSATRFRREGVIYKPFPDSIELQCGLAWRTGHRWPVLASFSNALLATRPSFQQSDGIASIAGIALAPPRSVPCELL